MIIWSNLLRLNIFASIRFDLFCKLTLAISWIEKPIPISTLGRVRVGSGQPQAEGVFI